MCRCMWLCAVPSHALPPKAGRFPPSLRTDPSDLGGEDGGRAEGSPAPDAPGGGTPGVAVPFPEALCSPAPSVSGAGFSPPPGGNPGRSPLLKFVSGACCGSQVKKPVCKQPPASCPGSERRRGFVSAAQNPRIPPNFLRRARKAEKKYI